MVPNAAILMLLSKCFSNRVRLAFCFVVFLLVCLFGRGFSQVSSEPCSSDGVVRSLDTLLDHRPRLHFDPRPRGWSWFRFRFTVAILLFETIPFSRRFTVAFRVSAVFVCVRVLPLLPSYFFLHLSVYFGLLIHNGCGGCTTFAPSRQRIYRLSLPSVVQQRKKKNQNGDCGLHVLKRKRSATTASESIRLFDEYISEKFHLFWRYHSCRYSIRA